jgi:hypothetical protein
MYLVPVLLLLQSMAAGAQNVVFTASADATRIGLADRFQITYTIQDVGGATFNPAASLRDFRIVSGPYRYQSTNIQAIGNQMVQTASQSFTFVVQPKHTGVIRLAPAEVVDANGRRYKSNALQVEVVPGSVMNQRQGRAPATSGWDDDPFGGGDPFAALRQQQARMRQLMSARMAPPGRQQAAPQTAPQAAAPSGNLGKDIFIRVEVDKKAVRLGEQVTAVYKLYSRLPMQVSISKLPALNGFWTQDFTVPRQQKPVEEILNGTRYQVFTLKKSALFPQQPGTLTLDPAEAEGTARIAVQGNSADDPFGSSMMNDPFFDDPFGDAGYKDIPVHLKSMPVSIQVSELPAAGRPANFTGAVGDFRISASLDKSALSTDEVATLKVTISGSGNLKLFDAPQLALPEGLDSYAPNILDTITGRATTISGEKIITYSIAPRRAGNYEVPPVSLAWYDPRNGSYQSASTPSFRLQVKQGNATTATAAAGQGGAQIHDQLLSAASRPLVLSPLYWSMYALPLLLLAGITFYRRREEELVTDSAQHRNKLANKVAQKRLALAGAMLQKDDARGFYGEISKAIWLYLSDKLNIPLSGLGKQAALQAMEQRGVPSPIQQQISKVLDECELALYASTGNNHQMQQTFSEAACIITGLERTLRVS